MNRGESNDLALYRGNSADFVLRPVYENGNDVVLEKGDRILFTVRSRPDRQSREYYKKVLCEKDYDKKGQLVLHLKPEDTLNMEVHTYWYDVAIYFADGTFYTFVPFSRFDVLPTLGDVSMLCHRKHGDGGGGIHGKVEGIVEKCHTEYVTELIFGSREEFPEVGMADKLYVAVDEDTVYRFDTELNKYMIIGSNPANIKEIFCKL